MKINIKIILFSLITTLFCNIFLTFPVLANDIINTDLSGEINDQAYKAMDTIGFPRTSNIGNIAETIIKSFLSLLAIIFIILIIVAGYSWMTAAGEESKVTYAKDTIKRAIIGIIIIVAAYAITAFVFKNLSMGDSSSSSTSFTDWDQ